MNNIFRRITFPLVMLVLFLMALEYFHTAQPSNVTQYSFTKMYSAVTHSQVKSVSIAGDQLNGVLTNGKKFVTTLPPNGDPTLQSAFIKNGVQVRYTSAATPWYDSPLFNTLLWVILLAALMFFLMQQTQGGGNRVMQFGKSRARLHTDDRKRVTFDDVAGVEEVKEELAEVVDFLKHPKRYVELGARIPKGVLLFGEPGTGKTLLARAVAGEAGVPFFSISGSDFVEMFVGVGASRVRDLFDQAKKSAPCIVFIDEIDAVGRQRGAGYGGGHDEREQTLNQLLVEMDGFGINEGIIVIAATNRPDVLDPALLRPGRFDRQVVIHRPDLQGRKEILAVHAANKPLEPTADLAMVARRTPGFTGADLANALNEAALLAARRHKKRIGMPELDEAIERVIGGPQKKSRLMNEKEKRKVAYHEVGHALIGHLLPNADPVVKVTIIPRGMGLGYTLQMPAEDRYLITKEEILDRITAALGGRAAEELIFGEITSGAADDLDKVTKMARRMITELGMSETLGPMTYGTKQDQVFLGRDLMRDRNYSEEIAAMIDRETRRIVHDCYERAKQTLTDNREKLHEIAQKLLEKETIEGSELEAMIEGRDVAI